MLARFGAVTRRAPFFSASRLLLSHNNFVRCFARDRDGDGDGVYENEAGFDADGFEDEDAAVTDRDGPNATQPDGPGTDSDPDGPHIHRLIQEAQLPQHNGDDIVDDREEIREELAFRQSNQKLTNDIQEKKNLL